MNPHGTDFALHFDGLKADSPDALRELKEICLTDLALSIEDTNSILASLGRTAVLYRSGSTTDLERVAEHLRSIGAHVEIRGPNTDTITHPHTDITPSCEGSSDVDRLFRTSNTLESPPQTDYYYSRQTPSAEPVVAHFSAALAEPEPVSAMFMSYARPALRWNSLTSFMVWLAVVSACSLAYAIFLASDSSKRTPSLAEPSTFLARQKIHDSAQTALLASASTKMWSGRSIDNESPFQLQLSALKASDSVSVRLSVFSEDHTGSFRGAESDPAILKQTEPNTWKGSVPLHTFIVEGGARRTVIGEADIVARGALTPLIEVTVRYPSIRRNAAIAEDLSRLLKNLPEGSFQVSPTLQPAP